MKILFILSLVMIAVAGVFGYMNREEYVGKRLEKDANNLDLQKRLESLDQTVEEIEGVHGELTVAEGERDEQIELFRRATRELAAAEGVRDGVRRELDAGQAEKERVENELRSVTDKFPGITIDTIGEDIARLEAEVQKLDADLGAKDTELTAAETALARAEEQLGRMRERQAARNAAFQRNSLQAMITAVNADWGFCVINVGANAGVTGDSTFVVMRGTQSVGKLTVMSIEGGQTICNIIEDTIPVGFQIQPGDMVIMEKLRG